MPRGKDKGADLLATFLVAGAFQQVVAVQAKHWQPDPPVGPDVVQQLINGIEAESANLGMVITSGSISEEASPAFNLPSSSWSMASRPRSRTARIQIRCSSPHYHAALYAKRFA